MRTMFIVLITAAITSMVTAAMVSPKHAAIMRLLFWDLPTTIVERIIPFYGS
jgi:hypothetical protein